MKKIFLAGHKGTVGSAILRKLSLSNKNNITTCDKSSLDLLNQKDVETYFRSNKFDEVYLAAAKVGGILANDNYPADFIYQNLMIQLNVINSAHQNNIPKLLFLGSSCIYPKFAKQPIKEESLLTGKLESTNQFYALAKIAGIKLCQSFRKQFGRDYRSIMPTNIYGENDNFHLENSHVIPGLIRKIHDAKISKSSEVEIWGTGKPLREFLYVDDLADASIFLMNLSSDKFFNTNNSLVSHINVGSGIEYSISDLAHKIKNIVGFKGNFIFNHLIPDGTPRKLLDISRLTNLGWKSSTDLNLGLQKTYSWFLENQKNFREK
jgi:GDP-L-fucose synthase